MIMLSLLGLGIGAASIDPLADETVAGGLLTSSAVFVIVVQLIALGVGGFVAARLAGIPRAMSSGLHGAAVWAVATIAAVWLATTAVGSMISGGASMVSSAASGLGQAGSAMMPDDIALPEISPSELEMNDLPQPVQEIMKENGITPQRFRAESQEMFQTVFDRNEREAAKNAVSDAVRKTLADPSTVDSNFETLTQELTGENGLFSTENKQEAMQEMNSRFGISEAEAEKAYDQVVQQANEAVQGAQQSMAELKQQSLEMADAAAEGVSQAAFGAFIASLVGLIVAVGIAVVGRPKTIVGAEARDYGHS